MQTRSELCEATSALLQKQVIRTLKEQCVHRQQASRVIGDWITFYNHRRPHQALCVKTPAATYALERPTTRRRDGREQ